MAAVKAFLFLFCVVAVLSQSIGSVSSRHHFFDKFAALLQNKNPFNSESLSKPNKPVINFIIPTSTDTDTSTSPLDPEPEYPIDKDTDIEPPTTLTDTSEHTPSYTEEELDEEEGIDEPDSLDRDEVDGADGGAGDTDTGATPAVVPAEGDDKVAGDMAEAARFNTNETDDIIENDILKLKDDALENGATSSEHLRAQRIFFNRRPKLTRRQKLRLRKQKQRVQQRQKNKRRTKLNRQKQLKRYRRVLAAYKKQLRERSRLINQINKKRKQRRRLWRLLKQLRQESSKPTPKSIFNY